MVRDIFAVLATDLDTNTNPSAGASANTDTSSDPDTKTTPTTPTTPSPSPSPTPVTVGFTNGPDYIPIPTWSSIGIEYTAPFSLFDRRDAHLQAKLENFIRYCFLLNGKVRSIGVGLDFLMDLREAAEDVGWNWRVWRENGGIGASGFTRETRARDRALTRERQREGVVRGLMKRERGKEERKRERERVRERERERERVRVRDKE